MVGEIDGRSGAVHQDSALLYIGRNSDRSRLARTGEQPRKRKKIAHRVTLHLADLSATWKVTQWATYKFLFFYALASWA